MAAVGGRCWFAWFVGCMSAFPVLGQIPAARIPHQNVIPEGGALADHLAETEVTAQTWPSEVLNSTAGGVLKKIGAVVGGADAATIDAYVSASYQGGTLRPDKLEEVWEGDGLRIVRGPTPANSISDLAGFKASLKSLGRPFDGRTFKTKFKIDRVELLPDGKATIEAIYLAMGTGRAGFVQQNARWLVSWDVSGGVEHPILTGIIAGGIEEISRSKMLFSDCTEAAFGTKNRFKQYLLPSIDHWWGRLDGAMGLSLYGDYGVAIGDVDNDGLEDIYVCMPGGLSNMLLRHNPDGTLTDISNTSGVNLYNDTGSALIVDVDNDGRQDMILGTQSHVAVMRGLGNGRFEDAGAIILGSPLSLSAADYDGDGLVDLYVCFYINSRSEGTAEVVYDSNRGMANRLWRNEGNCVFRDVTGETGLSQNNERYSFAAVWEDYDNDGDPDLYVANDFGRNNLYRNDGGKFSDVAAEAGVEDMAAGMGIAWADYDHDGDFDLYVSNMYSSAGGRVSYQRQFQRMVGGERVNNYGYFARGNTLFHNKGDGTFEDASVEAGVTMGRWAWGAEFLDFNNDGWADIFVPNGYITNEDSRDL